MENNKNKFRSGYTWKCKRVEIMKRDNNQCKICGSNTKLQVHHIYSLDTHWQLRLDNNNLVTLCESCHHAVHNGMYNPIFLLNKIK